MTEGSLTPETAPERFELEFTCSGQATGKMRNELDVRIVHPIQEQFTLATDEGPFHGGDATAPPPLALFIGGLTGCLMTQIRAFAKRMDVVVDDLKVETSIVWDWAKEGRVYETAPKSLAIDVLLDSPSPIERQKDLIAAAKRGCFIEQTLGRANIINHRLKVGDDWMTV